MKSFAGGSFDGGRLVSVLKYYGDEVKVWEKIIEQDMGIELEADWL